MRGDDKIGTTLKGIGPAYADKARRVGLRAGDVLDPAAFRRAAVKAAPSPRTRSIEQAGGEPLDVDDDRRAFRRARCAPRAVRHRHGEPAARRAGAGAHLLLEGAQATFLDLDHGTYPYVTSSNPTAGGACTGTGLGPRDIDRIVGITKAYTTRVGAGPFPTELTDADGDRLVEVGREFGTVTGRRRRAGWLDCVMLRHAVRLNSLTELALTKLDVLDGFESVKVCTDYRLDGHGSSPTPIAPTCSPRSSRCTRRSPGGAPSWAPRASRRTCRDRPALHRARRGEVGVPVRVVGVGAERDDYLIWTT